ncbi:hypothetical protein ACJ72_07497 [Emergomyces africanus]|uniref:Uncharacterized protein n=1 Tax=Emergomyces africanus TaxID=1955775 RepID=A0A1B7NNJ1_9EURO|nr:hypothetical protein ACJ72_07497 [Emergomyces africanus]
MSTVIKFLINKLVVVIRRRLGFYRLQQIGGGVGLMRGPPAKSALDASNGVLGYIKLPTRDPSGRREHGHGHLGSTVMRLNHSAKKDALSDKEFPS